jgi:hypothetical protein
METAYPFSDRALQLVVLVTFLILACALVFTFIAGWLRTRNIREERRWTRLESMWEPMLFAILTGDRKEREIYARVLRKDRRRFVAFLLGYGRQLRGVEQDTVLRLAAPYLERIAKDVRHRSPEVRASALQALGELSVTEYHAEFLHAVKDPSPLVAMIAIQALARQGEPDDAEKLLHELDRFQHWNPGHLSTILALLGPESRPILRTALADASRPARIRAVIARTLSLLTDVGSADLAGQVLEAEHDTDLIVAVLGLIEKVGGPDQLPVVRRLLHSTDQAVRALAVTTLSRIGTTDDSEHIRAALNDESPWVLLHAARALKRMGATNLLAEVAGSAHPGAVAAQEMLWGEQA